MNTNIYLFTFHELIWCYSVSFDRVRLHRFIHFQICVVANLLFIQTKAMCMVATKNVLIPISLYQNQHAIIATHDQEKTVTITTKFHEIWLNTKPFAGAVY